MFSLEQLQQEGQFYEEVALLTDQLADPHALIEEKELHQAIMQSLDGRIRTRSVCCRTPFLL